MAPRLTRSLAALVAGFDALAPDRDRRTDGWIGNAAHQVTVSGHNPDDTPGSLPEYQDADDVPEVRAVDVDHDLRHPTVTMGDAIARILATPADRARLRYVIYRGRIASRSNGWRWVPYRGANPHDEHGHFSGDPATDDDDRPWSVATMGDTMTITRDDLVAAPWTYNGRGMPSVPAGKSTLWVLGTLHSLAMSNARKLDAVAATLAGHANGDWLRERFAEIDQRAADLARRVGEVPGDVVDQLGALDVDDLVGALAAAGVDMGELAEAAMSRAAGTELEVRRRTTALDQADAVGVGGGVDQLDVSGLGVEPGTDTVRGLPVEGGDQVGDVDQVAAADRADQVAAESTPTTKSTSTKSTKSK